jgi:hypothetical protein
MLTFKAGEYKDAIQYASMCAQYLHSKAPTLTSGHLTVEKSKVGEMSDERITEILSAVDAMKRSESVNESKLN